MFNLFFGFPDNTKVEIALILTIGSVRLVDPGIKASNKKTISGDFFQGGNGKCVIICLNYFEYAKKRVAEMTN